MTEAQLIAARFELVKDILADIGEQFDKAAETVFREKVACGDIVFKLLGPPNDNLNVTFEEMMTVRVPEGDLPLFRRNTDPLERSLYDKVFRKDVNGFEEDVALYLDGRAAVDWWWRIVARKGWALQGWRRNRVYPDFLVKLESDGATARMLVLESKGKHLEGSPDTAFKEKLFALLEDAYATGKEAGDVELFADAPNTMKFRILLQQDAWQSRLEESLA